MRIVLQEHATSPEIEHLHTSKCSWDKLLQSRIKSFTIELTLGKTFFLLKTIYSIYRFKQHFELFSQWISEITRTKSLHLYLLCFVNSISMQPYEHFISSDYSDATVRRCSSKFLKIHKKKHVLECPFNKVAGLEANTGVF